MFVLNHTHWRVDTQRSQKATAQEIGIRAWPMTFLDCSVQFSFCHRLWWKATFRISNTLQQIWAFRCCSFTGASHISTSQILPAMSGSASGPGRRKTDETSVRDGAKLRSGSHESLAGRKCNVTYSKCFSPQWTAVKRRHVSTEWCRVKG